MSNPPVIIGNGRIDIAAANSVTAQPTYRYQIRTDGLKFFNPITQTFIDAFELVEQVLEGEPFILANTSYAQLNIFSSSLNTPFSVDLQHNAGQISLRVTHPKSFGPHGDGVFEALDITFIESRVDLDTSLSVTGQVSLNFINHLIALDVKFTPEVGLSFVYNSQNNPAPLVFDGIGTLALDNLTIKQNSAGLVSPQVLYLFDEGEGQTIVDSAGTTEPINLTIEDQSAVRWLDGGLAVDPKEQSIIASPAPRRKQSNPITRLVKACQDTNELTIEALIKPENTVQGGPARILTMSRNTGRRNFTLGQGLSGDNPTDLYTVRVRTETSNLNGLPATTTPAGILQAELTHVVFTCNKVGQTRIYVNGELQVEELIEGDFSNWDTDLYRLALANELTGQRPWSGEYYQIVIYNRVLTEDEIASGLAPTIEANGKLTLDANFGIVANETFDTTFDYNLLERTLTSNVDISTVIASQLSFNSLGLEWSIPSGETTWQLTGRGQVNLTIFDQSFDFFSSDFPST